MAPIELNGTPAEEITVNGEVVDEVMANGQLVYQAGPDIPDSVTDHWPIDDGSGSTLSNHIGSTNISLDGPDWVSDSNSQGELHIEFGAGDQAIGDDHDHFHELDELTWSMWIRTDATTSDDGILVADHEDGSSVGSETVGWGLFHFEDDLRFGWGSSAFDDMSISASNILTGDWVHVAVTFEGEEEARIYIDGALEASDSVSETVTSANGEVFTIGVTGDGSDRQFEGEMDDFYFADEALSASEIEQLYQNHPRVDSGNEYGEVTVTNDPYDGVDWDTAEQYTFIQHIHSSPAAGPASEGVHETLDNYIQNYYDSGQIDITYDAMGHGPKNDDGDVMSYPWETLSQRDSDYEDRDPAQLGCCDIGYFEATDHGEHINCVFASEQTSTSGDRFDAYDTVLSSVSGDTTGSPVVFPAHPDRYIDSRDDWTEYIDDYQDYNEDEVPGWTLGGRTAMDEDRNENDGDYQFLFDAWDSLLGEFLPERQIWGYMEDDCGKDTPSIYRRDDDSRGGGFGLRWMQVPMDPSEYDLENDLEGTRKAFRDKFLSGQIFSIRRDWWDPEEDEDPTDYPEIDSIEVDGDTITVETDGDVEWISGTDENGVRNIVETGDTIELDADCIPYVRAHVTTDDGETTTQPFTVEGVE